MTYFCHHKSHSSPSNWQFLGNVIFCLLCSHFWRSVFPMVCKIFIYWRAACLDWWNMFSKTLNYLMFPLLMEVRTKCSDSCLWLILIFSLSASFCAFFLSNSSCLQFSSCARVNILTKLRRVETTAKIKWRENETL